MTLELNRVKLEDRPAALVKSWMNTYNVTLTEKEIETLTLQVKFLVHEILEEIQTTLKE